jgi:4-hydroxy-tetrahydrodipicolinate reductase
MLKICVAGAAGRMGGAVIKAAHEAGGFEIGAALVRPGHAWSGRPLSETLFVENSDLRISEDPGAAVENCQVLVDFSEPTASVNLAGIAAGLGRPMVIGTTGFDPAQQEALKACAKQCPMVWSSNMSQGVNVMLGLVREIARFLGEGFAVEVLEAYHDQKKDAPSGTAMELIKELASAFKWPVDDVSQYGRKGNTGPRPSREIGVHAIRGGDLSGENSVLFIGQGERLELTYRSQSRKPVVQGALKAAAWVSGQPPGLFDMRDVLGLR